MRDPTAPNFRRNRYRRSRVCFRFQISGFVSEPNRLKIKIWACKNRGANLEASFRWQH